MIRYVRLLSAALRQFLSSPRSFISELENYFTRRGTLVGPVAGDEPPIVIDSLPNVVPVNFAVTTANESYLNVMIPGMALWAMSGGPNTALNLTFRLARAGLPVRYISTDVPVEPDHEHLWDHFRQLTGIEERFPHVQIVDGSDRSKMTEIGENDVFFGTAWWTVQMIKHALERTRTRAFVYFIQDFEPGFYPWSTVHSLALETYSLNFRAIVNESLLMEFFTEHGIGRFADAGFADQSIVFEPAVDRTFFYPEERRMTGRKRLLFYARPNAPRNLYELGIVVLKRAAERGAFPPDEWDLHFMGESLLPARLTRDVVIQPLPWLDYRGYAKLLRESDVGLSLMLSPHTGYPALEMAACGMTVVTNTFYSKTAKRLESISTNIIAASPTVDSIVDAVIEATHTARSESARTVGADVRLPHNWDDVFDSCVPGVLAMVENCRRAGGIPVS